MVWLRIGAASEIAFAGGKYGTNAPAWYYYNSTGDSAVGTSLWWTMSPYFYGNASAFYVHGSIHVGQLTYNNVHATAPGIRPVLSLKSCVTYVSGDGSSDNPYTVTLDNACSLAEN